MTDGVPHAMERTFVGFDEAGIDEQSFFVWYFVVRGERNLVDR
jgi:hypothetical protein